MSKCVHCNKWFITNEPKTPVPTQPGRMAHPNCVANTMRASADPTQVARATAPQQPTIPQYIPRYGQVQAQTQTRPRRLLTQPVRAPAQPAVTVQESAAPTASAIARFMGSEIIFPPITPAATPTLVASLKKDVTNELTCCICLEEKPSITSFAPCMHSACTDCAKSWVSRSSAPKCPSCRTAVKGTHRNHQLENIAKAWGSYSRAMEDMLSRASISTAAATATTTAPANTALRTSPVSTGSTRAPMSPPGTSARRPVMNNRRQSSDRAGPLTPVTSFQFTPLTTTTSTPSSLSAPFIFGAGSATPNLFQQSSTGSATSPFSGAPFVFPAAAATTATTTTTTGNSRFGNRDRTLFGASPTISAAGCETPAGAGASSFQSIFGFPIRSSTRA